MQEVGVVELFERESVYTVAEVAAALRVSRATVVRAIQASRLRAFRVERQWRLLGSEVLLYLTAREASPALSAKAPRNDQPGRHVSPERDVG